MGGVYDVLVDKARVMDDTGNIIGVAGASSDISTFRKKEEELAKTAGRNQICQA
jgi:hypothetical protein